MTASMYYSTPQHQEALIRLQGYVQGQKQIRDLVKAGVPMEMAKAVTTTNLATVVPQDLERVAYNALWDIENSNVLMALKLIPTTDAFSVIHLFDRITSYGRTRGMGFVGETSIPQASDPGFAQRTVNIRLLAALAEVYKLAALEKTISVGGTTGAKNISAWTLLRDFLWRTNRAFYFADTTTQRLGESSTVFKGLRQQIREGTDGTVDTSPFGSHVIDMEGQALTPDTLRRRLLQLINNFGMPTTMIASPEVRADFEARLDAAQRMAFPINGQPFVMGARVRGFRTSDISLAFFDDLQLGPTHSFGQYVATAQSGAPNRPTVSASYSASPSGSNVSKFDTNTKGAGSYFYIITEIKDGNESLGTRWPTSATQAIAAGGEVTFTLTASDSTSDGFRIYRGGLDENGSVEANTSAYWMKDVANSSDGSAVTAYDLNDDRAGLHNAIVLDVKSPAQNYFDQLQQGQVRDTMTPREMATDFGTQMESPGNTVARARLGPEYGTMELAAFALHEARPVLYTAQALELRAPSKALWFKNIAPAITT